MHRWINAIGIWAIGLFASTSYAGNKFGTPTFAVEKVPMSVEVNGPTVDCNSLAQGQFTDSRFPVGSNHQPAIQFVLGAFQFVYLEVRIWESTDCSGEPDATASGDIAFDPGLNTFHLEFSPGIPDGTLASFKWIVGRCPITSCVGYTNGFGLSPPYVCGAVAP